MQPENAEENPTTSSAMIREEDRQDVVVMESEIYGDEMRAKHPDNIRLVFMNINSVPPFNDSPKNDMLYQSICKSEADIVGLSEVNRNWNVIKASHRWYDRTKSWFETSHSTITHNVQDLEATPYQPGGNILISINKAAHRVLKSERDTTGLGRWTSTTYRGRMNLILRVIVAYRPCKSAGPNSAFMQQQRYFDIIGRSICPRQALLEDLGASIKYFHSQGEQVVLMMDCNTHTQTHQFQVWLTDVGLENGIVNLDHPNPPATFHRGTQPIDGIFVSPALQALQKGFLQFGYFPSDHRALWMDLSMTNAFGCRMCALTPPSTRKLKLSDVRTTKRWTQLYNNFIIRHRLHEKVYQLEAEIGKKMSSAQEEEYEKIMELCGQGIKYADKRCRKKRMGAVPFSVELNSKRQTIELWKAIETKKSGCTYNWTKLRRLNKRSKVSNPMALPLPQVKDNLQQAYTDYYKTKQESKKLRLTFLEEKARDLAAEKDLDKDNVYSQLIQREKVRASARKIKYALGKVKKGGVTRVEVIQNGNAEEVVDSNEIFRVCADENESKFQQTRYTPCSQPPLRDLLGFNGLTEFADSILSGTFTAPPDTPPYVIELFQQLKKPDNVCLDSVATHLTVKQFQAGWKNMREYTSAGKLGLHFGHMKDCSLHTFLSHFESLLSHIPFVLGYSPRVWQVGVMVMIHKKQW